MSGYRNDVYVSWRRAEPVRGWFRAYFLPEFQARLSSTLGHEPKVFVDEDDLDPGDRWKQRLGKELRCSKLLLAIWEPQYFRSAACLAELNSMAAREEAVGLFSPARPEGLIVPVVVQDGKHFEPWLGRQYHRMEGVLTDAPAFRASPRYLEFLDGVQSVCDAVEHSLQQVPPWSAGFPLVDPVGEPDVPVLLPRFL